MTPSLLLLALLGLGASAAGGFAAFKARSALERLGWGVLVLGGALATTYGIGSMEAEFERPLSRIIQGAIPALMLGGVLLAIFALRRTSQRG